MSDQELKELIASLAIKSDRLDAQQSQNRCTTCQNRCKAQ